MKLLYDLCGDIQLTGRIDTLLLYDVEWCETFSSVCSHLCECVWMERWNAGDNIYCMSKQDAIFKQLCYVEQRA